MTGRVLGLSDAQLLSKFTHEWLNDTMDCYPVASIKDASQLSAENMDIYDLRDHIMSGEISGQYITVKNGKIIIGTDNRPYNFFEYVVSKFKILD